MISQYSVSTSAPLPADLLRSLHLATSLVLYGILNELAKMRVHVGVATQTLYIFPVEHARDIVVDMIQAYMANNALDHLRCLSDRFDGWCVASCKLPHVHRVHIPDHIFCKYKFHPEDGPVKLGRKAEKLVLEMIRLGLVFDNILAATLIVGEEQQIAGGDLELIVAYHVDDKPKPVVQKLIVQVKCDFMADCREYAYQGTELVNNVLVPVPKKKYGKGGLFLQTAERNPEHLH